MKSTPVDKIQRLYFVALVPPEPIKSQVWQMKEEVLEKYGSKAALKSPAHVTLHMPFTFRVDREDRIIDCLKTAIADKKQFEITHDGFGCFEPRVIYVNVDKTEPLEILKADVVKQMRLDLKLQNADYKNLPFHPHMTIAFRDLKKPVFQEAWTAYENREYRASWKCDSVCLLKHNGAGWDVLEEIGFNV
ncbi:MAG: 2'-5' RNA ligase [Flammeovirgaceae bacterium]|nr:2'-5' RNA ligase [Flammeovirgaceae bacterium]HCX22380.1 2'-5' RNA ligase [Cytophagales bacterium]|tara:strand:+ start:5203 stop:5772 length:570 start_codon:yes stop_codon:yes gene_type:complete